MLKGFALRMTVISVLNHESTKHVPDEAVKLLIFLHLSSGVLHKNILYDKREVLRELQWLSSRKAFL